MSVSNGQKANADTFNSSFMSREVDTSTVGQVDLNNADAASGATLANVQRELNGQASFVGDVTGSTFDRLPTWNSDTIGAPNDPVKTRVDNVQTQVETNTTTLGTKLGGAGSSTDNAMVRWDGATGTAVQDSGIIVDDSDNVTGVNDLTIDGDLTVNGTTTTIDTATLTVEDANITINSGGNDASSEGSGLTVERTSTDGSFVYEDALASKFKLGALGSEVEVADISSSQVITNKDIDGGTATNTSRITVPKETTANLTALTRKEATIFYDTDQANFFGDDGTQIIPLGGGGGGEGGINYISQSDAEAEDISDWNTYADAAQDTPVDGTGGSPTVTFTRTTTGGEVLRGTASFEFAKDAADRQGEGVSIDFSIDPKDTEAELQVNFDYTTSANFVDGDMGVFVYDVTNAAVISVFKLRSTSVDIDPASKKTFIGSFVSSDSTSYRLIYHVRSTSALAYDVFLDRVQVGPLQTVGGGYISTEWVDTGAIDIDGTTTDPTKGTTSVDMLSWRRDGSDMVIQFEFAQSTAGTTGSGKYLIPIPEGLSADLNIVQANTDLTNARSGVVGVSQIVNGSLSQGTGTIGLHDAQNMHIMYEVAGSVGFWDSAFFQLTTVTSLTGQARIPIEGWQSAVTGTGVSAILTDLSEAETITIGATTSAPTKGTIVKDEVRWRREGQFMYAHYEYEQSAVGSAGTGDYLIEIPGGFEMDTDIIGLSTGSGIDLQKNTIGEFAGSASGSFDYNNGHAIPFSATEFRIAGRIAAGVTPFGAGAGGLNQATAKFGGWIKVPIKGWTSNAVQTFRAPEFKSAESASFALNTAGYLSGEWAQMTGNSVTLERGTWMLIGQTQVNGTFGSTAVGRNRCKFSTANGDNTTTLPPSITSIRDAGPDEADERNSSSNELNIANTIINRVTLTEEDEIFLNVLSEFSLSNVGSIVANIYAERIG